MGTTTGTGPASPAGRPGAGGAVDEYVCRRPAPALRPYVARYTGYRQAGLRPALHRGLPSPYLTLILTLDDRLTVAAHPDPRQPPGHYDTLLGGLHAAPALITHEGRQSGVQIALGPLGARALLGPPAGELAHLDVPADAVLGRHCAELHDRLRQAATWPERFAVLDRVLPRLLRPERTARPEVARAWHRLLASGGAVSVPELAEEAGWSTRHLTGRFRTEIGLTPKAAARVVRFDRARRLLEARAVEAAGAVGARGADGTVAAGAGELGLAVLAAECGYFDQAHLAREFRALAGCAPSRWLELEHGALFRNVQAAEGAPAPQWDVRGLTEDG
ncbi:helix-turn-helix transcriptional regulator [Streptomyces verrucosisporus]|uniref:helix-turn-helix domain-containing protein n=1 Tax=Streptomyces verrucosisporus TaxID=1695161 RepID=UPI0019D054A1|nr:helix-turn-helix transcriptional regulator [Streptomyces verrucosisporus]MBN3929466.1 helix-turn-helix transcriptional regulator [Streptomyces verrucosisporus]